jgi:hypothetical protein
VIVGGGSSETEKLADLLGSVIDVAVNVAMLVVEMLAGALYVTVLVVDPLNEPSPVSVDQVTPALLGSLFTVAVINCEVFWSIENGCAGEKVTLMAGLIVMLRPLVVAEFPTESVSLTENGNVPDADGGPAVIEVLAPDAELRLNPVGNGFPTTTDHVYPLPDPPLAVNVSDVG